ncbi:MAG TPA: winged helix DNA-binding domain-containing protein [Candidatus Lachnoclostridium avicola]|nr:winged helix DNA-binding domain-containing protein [Candidatus Lachnoclostridium avicola]
MNSPTEDQIRSFRLRSHHLDRIYGRETLLEAAGACGLQNSPPGAWEAAIHNRIPELGGKELRDILEENKILLQAWSFRGVPVVFPAEERRTFLSALIPAEGEPWIYTRGIGLALDALGLDFDYLLRLLLQVIPGLDHRSISGKNELDQMLAAWMEPFLPEEKRQIWNQPSMYGSPDRQTVGGAAVSFLLRPCSFMGQVVFGKRRGGSPEFTSAGRWLNEADREPGQTDLPGPDGEASRCLVRKFLHCYGPSSPDLFGEWLGCSGKQARRMWNLAAEEMEPVSVMGKKKFFLREDRQILFESPDFSRGPLLLSGYDPYLDQRDRQILQPDSRLRGKIWRTVANPGAVVTEGRVTGIWTARKKKDGLEVDISLWEPGDSRRRLTELAEDYAAFRGLALSELTWTEGGDREWN